MNVTVFGDSIAKGLTLKNSRPVRLAKNAVEIIEDYYNIKIQNNSCFGQTITRLNEKGLIDNYLQSISSKDKNIVVIALGGNDSDYDWKQISNDPEKNYESKTSLGLFVHTYRNLILKLKKRKVNVYICALPAIESHMFFENYVCSLAEEDKILKFLDNDVSRIARHQEIFNNAIVALALETNTKLLDIRTPFLSSRNIHKLYCEDGLHPNEDGQQLIADTIINYFKNNN